MKQISTTLFLYEDTCHVYVIKMGDKAVLIDFGNGAVLDHLAEIGIREVTDVLMTHHHRDQGQGLRQAVEKGIKLWVPHAEQDLFQHVNEHWQRREIDNNYNMRQDRFSLLYSVPIQGTLKDYETYYFNGVSFSIAPTPGHTTGSISIFVSIDGQSVAFTGDLIYGPGKVWSLSATQWSYNGAEGIPYSVLSLLYLKERKPDVLLPSHGQLMANPAEAIDQLVDRFTQLMKARDQNPRLFLFREKPYMEITPHLLQNRTSFSNSYVLLSESKKALIIDYGYDFIGGLASGTDRAARRPWLYTLPYLKETYGVEKIEVVLPTHFHDDHVAGFNLLREVEGTEVWCPENFADILENPKNYNLPCLWFDPIPVDRRIPLEKTFEWEEYRFQLFEQSGHTLYAVAIQFEVDGKSVLAIGDQYQGEAYNYVYSNKFRIWDYAESARLYEKLRPDLLISGHYNPIYVSEAYLETIKCKGTTLEKLHHDLLPLDDFNFGAEGFGVTIDPYQIFGVPGSDLEIAIDVTNPFSDTQKASLDLILPIDWEAENKTLCFSIEGYETKRVTTTLTLPKGVKGSRERLAVDLTIGDTHFGQHAEALVTIKTY